MKTDRYTKIVLTFIACALSILVFQNAFEIKSANASAKVNKVAICDTSGKYCADVLYNHFLQSTRLYVVDR